MAKYIAQTTSVAADGITPNGPYGKTYYDAFDRVIRVETQGFDGTIVYQDTQYDSKGRVDRASRPYYSGQTPQWTVMSYDGLDRPIATTLPDNTQTTVAYNGLITRSTNALGQTQSAQKNSQGKVIKVTDATNNSVTYQYDAIGNLTATTDAQGNIVTLTYDLRGRKTQMVDPDMGTWTYEYDVLGQLTKQTDAKGQITTIAYDKLGRTLQRNESDLVSTWTYDTCAKGIGKLCQSTADNGYVSTSSYDPLGRPTSNTTIIDTSYTSGVTYDANGRIATQTWPTGFAVKYVYNSLGYLTEVRNNADNALYWQANSKDAQGHLLQQTFGNAIVTQQVYDPLSNRLKNIYAGAGNGVQNLSYGYDNGGNMTSRNDANQNLVETFGYDSLNRLTNATINSAGAGVVTTTYAYDSIGNITSRSDMGAYTSGATNSRPHGLKEVNFVHGGKLQYTYDANGALISEVALDSTGAVITNRGRSEFYTSYNMPQAMGAPGISLAFIYGPEHQRVKQIAPSATTIYLNPDNAGGLLYEKDLKADGTIEHRHFITAGDGVIALVKKTGTTFTTLYMHRDHLGSTTTITNDQGAVIERMAYEPFGKRRYPQGNTDDGGQIVGVNTDRGYTNHEHLDELGLIHMNGRIYDPAIGRFMSADPNIQSPYDTQSYNRYTYVINNPLAYTDPSGYFSWRGIVRGTPFVAALGLYPTGIGMLDKPRMDFFHSMPGQAQVDSYIMTHQWANMAGQAVSAYYGGPMGAAMYAMYYSYEATGSMNAANRAGAISFGTAVAFSYVGANYEAGTYGSYAGHALVGCASTAASGGNCGNGALAAVVGKAVTNATGGDNWNDFTRGIATTLAGGTASAIGGGKFENGAMTAAYGYLFNALASKLGRIISSMRIRGDWYNLGEGYIARHDRVSGQAIDEIHVYKGSERLVGAKRTTLTEAEVLVVGPASKHGSDMSEWGDLPSGVQRNVETLAQGKGMTFQSTSAWSKIMNVGTSVLSWIAVPELGISMMLGGAPSPYSDGK